MNTKEKRKGYDDLYKEMVNKITNMNPKDRKTHIFESYTSGKISLTMADELTRYCNW